jgi:hypothetical protein
MDGRRSVADFPSDLALRDAARRDAVEGFVWTNQIYRTRQMQRSDCLLFVCDLMARFHLPSSQFRAILQIGERLATLNRLGIGNITEALPFSRQRFGILAGRDAKSGITIFWNGWRAT